MIGNLHFRSLGLPRRSVAKTGSTPNKSAVFLGPLIRSHQSDLYRHGATKSPLSFVCWVYQSGHPHIGCANSPPRRKSLAPLDLRYPRNPRLERPIFAIQHVPELSARSTSACPAVQLPFMNVHEQSLNVQPFLGRGAPYRTRIDTFVMRVRQSFDFLSAGEDSPGCLDSFSWPHVSLRCPVRSSKKHPKTPPFPPRSSFLKSF